MQILPIQTSWYCAMQYENNKLSIALVVKLRKYNNISSSNNSSSADVDQAFF
jgi:hypothetical protein